MFTQQSELVTVSWFTSGAAANALGREKKRE